MDQRRVSHLAKLARLSLEPAELERMATQVTRIVEYVSQLEAADTGGVEPTFNPRGGARLQLRPDEVRPGIEHEQVARMAPEFGDSLFRVPPMMAPDGDEAP